MTNTLSIKSSGQACGATVTGVDLSRPLDAECVADLRQAWLHYHVLSFPGQKLTSDDFEHFALNFGHFGNDTFFRPIAGRKHIAAVKREADETGPIFAEVFHSDWSFQKDPPAATLLYSLDIPPIGGDTLFANQQLALEKMPSELRAKLEGLTAIHSAEFGYSPTGIYADPKSQGSMAIEISDEAYERQPHPLFLEHPETGIPAIFSGVFSYIVGFEGMSDEDAMPLLVELSEWQKREEFIYRHQWEPDMLVMWDNRSVLHCATGGYEGHRRELHRITINS
ncbi:TauD/TfdA family dioxygenase [Halioglobus maricola]|uniref:TauD/TfdA family dioxygenase n=1 Tax=Halioglobus maricola TaxID=2601894 RepID=A0A5P9NID4_9GAMM|nr:TauD/TfdA family dioxygenase [Halioglobus maricola]QFU75561.1 TauD/TfdA family dioxygenase [Halioglobus maricola]